MALKTFSFPPFCEFKKRNSVSLKIGYYTAEIGIVAWGCNGCTKNTYVAEIMCGMNCISRFSCEYDYKNGSIDDLQTWYEVSCILLNEEFVKHITDMYLDKS